MEAFPIFTTRNASTLPIGGTRQNGLQGLAQNYWYQGIFPLELNHLKKTLIKLLQALSRKGERANKGAHTNDLLIANTKQPIKGQVKATP